MTDRYHQGVEELRELPVPDQWQQILTRAADPQPTVISLTEARRARRPRWPLMAAAVVVTALAIAAAIQLGTESASNVETGPVDTGPDAPPPDSTAPPTTTPPTSSTAPTTTTPTTPTTDPNAGGGGGVGQGEGQGQGDDEGQGETNEPPQAPDRPESDGDGNPIPEVCWETQLATNSGPDDLPPVQGEAVPDDPRLNDAVQPYHLGTFTSDANTQRAVFVVIGPFGEDGGEYLPHPVFREIWLAGSDADGWLAEFELVVNDQRCWINLFANGLTRDEMVGFLEGLNLAH